MGMTIYEQADKVALLGYGDDQVCVCVRARVCVCVWCGVCEHVCAYKSVQTNLPATRAVQAGAGPVELHSGPR